MRAQGWCKLLSEPTTDTNVLVYAKRYCYLLCWQNWMNPSVSEKSWKKEVSAPFHLENFQLFLLLVLIFFFFFFFLGPHPWHKEVPRLGLELELQLPASTTAKATWYPSLICNLHHRSWQRQIFNALNEARNQTRILTDTGRVLYCWDIMGTPVMIFVDIFLDDS